MLLRLISVTDVRLSDIINRGGECSCLKFQLPSIEKHLNKKTLHFTDA